MIRITREMMELDERQEQLDSELLRMREEKMESDEKLERLEKELLDMRDDLTIRMTSMISSLKEACNEIDESIAKEKKNRSEKT